MTVEDSIAKIRAEYKKPEHGDFIRLLEDAFSRKLSSADERELAKVARQRGWNLRWEHKFESALSCFSLAVKVFEGGGASHELYKLKKGIAFCESALGHPGRAITIFKDMLSDLKEIIKSAQYPSGSVPLKSAKFYPEYERMRCVFYMSVAYAKDDKLTEAEKCLEKASGLAGENTRFRGLILQGKGKIFQRERRFDEALQMMKRAEDVFRRSGNEYKVMNVREDIATLFHCLERYEDAIEEMNKVIEYYEKNREADHWAYFHRAASLERLTRHAEARKDYIKAVEKFDKSRRDIRAAHFRRTFSSSRAVIYTRAVMNALEVGEPEDAYMLLQKAKARSFVEMMINRQSYGSIPKELVRELRSAQEQLSKMEESDDAARQIALSERYAGLVREVERDAARLGANISLKALEIDRIRKKIPKGALVLDFLAGESETLVFAISHDTFEYFEINVSEDDLAAIIFDLNDFMVDAGTSSGEERKLKERAFKWSLRKFSEMFPEKLMKELIPSCESLVIVPHSSLHKFPFCLLIMENGRYLGEVKPLYYIDNIQRLGVKPFRAGGDICVAADPTEDLCSAVEEAAGIRALFGRGKCRVMKGSACRRKSVLAALEKYSMFHFAGHAVIDEGSQDMSRLLLADGALRVSDLFGRNIRSGFVFLNGCQTARGKVMPGDEMNSFSRAFHFAGADELIVNLWEVSDRHSPIMTKLFYENFLKGVPAEQALREAQKQANSEGLPPFIWAAFKVIK